MLAIIDNFILLKSELPKLIELSGYRNNYIAEQLGMNADYFVVKKKRGNFKDEEFRRIMKIISNQKVEDYCDKLIIKNAFPGNTMSASEFEKRMQWR